MLRNLGLRNYEINFLKSDCKLYQNISTKGKYNVGTYALYDMDASNCDIAMKTKDNIN